MIKPRPLRPGDPVALIAPSSPVSEEKIELSIQSIRFLGLEPIVFPSCFMKNGYLSGRDEARTKDVNDAFADPDIRGIFCVRGGYGATRILPMLDYESIRRNPKFFAGYSDITALHIVFNKLCGFITYHAPMPSRGYAALDPFTLNSLFNAVFAGAQPGKVENPPEESIETICPGIARGEITGGNLSVMTAALGSPYEIDTREKILFIEEVDELPYRIDRSLTALKLAGKLEAAAGIILGTFSDMPEEDVDPADTLSLSQIFDQIIRPLDIPTVYNLRSGHIYPQIVIPMGMRAELNATMGTVAFV
ncbi:MAG TPA: LD-carboxypeptidase [Clostridiales bacterium UBA9856]|jgi:muramoyltetrapeptide carboxypeptidase|nr:LD-carboxypeptidase [Clostridiales bacterium UBA9856]HOA42179.1 LD-carboxypeptidase [Bacillota bacterium]